jgi:ABC-type lipoprotein export system ATPase subunit
LSIHRQIGLTVVVVTHDADVATRFERTVTIRDGRVGVCTCPRSFLTYCLRIVSCESFVAPMVLSYDVLMIRSR